MTKERLDVVEYMKPVWEESVSFLVKIPNENSMMFYVNPFHVSTSLFIPNHEQLHASLWGYQKH